METIDLGLIKAIHSGLTNPDNITMIWYDDNVGVKIHKYYDTVTSSWVPLKSNSIISISWLELADLKFNSFLVPGIIYCITDRFNYQSGGILNVPNQNYLGDDRGLVYIKALTTNSFSRNVIREMYVPDSYGSGSIRGNFWNGVWHSTISCNIGELVIWGGKVWVSLTGSSGSYTDEITLDSTNWLLRSKVINTNNCYRNKQFSATYDFDTDYFLSQIDDKNNVIADDIQSHNIDINSIDISDWNLGSDTNITFYNNKFSRFLNNVVTNGGYIMYNSIFTISDNFLSSLYSNIINTFSSNACPDVYSNEMVDISGVIASNTIFNNKGGSISLLSAGSICDNNNISIYGSPILLVINGDILRNSSPFYSENNPTGNTIFFLANGSVTPTIDTLYSVIDNVRHSDNTNSGYIFDIDATSTTTSLDLSNDSLHSAEGKLIKLVKIASTHTINTIVNWYGKSVILRPEPGLTLTINHGTGSNNIRCAGGTNVVLNGSNYDWMEIGNENGIFYQKSIGKY